MPEFKDITRLSPLPIVDLHKIELPSDGLIVETSELCKKKFPGGKCKEHYSKLAAGFGKIPRLTQCPYGFATLSFSTQSSHLALTGFVPFPRLGGDAERSAAKHCDTKNKIATEKVTHAVASLKGTILHFENLEKESVKKHAVALHEIRKLNRSVKQEAERFCKEQSPTDPDQADNRVVNIWKSSELMSKQFDVIEFLANEALIEHLELKNPIDVYRIFDKCIHIYTPVGSQPRIKLHGHKGYSGPIMASDKIFPIIPSVLIENALKYSIPATDIYVELWSEHGRCNVSVTNQSTRTTELTPHIFQKGVRQSSGGEGSGNGLYLAHLIAKQHQGSIKVKSKQLVADVYECEFTAEFPERL
jgi:light-regulated signal transduction histidine kinase (bacteriophytochrome)